MTRLRALFKMTARRPIKKLYIELFVPKSQAIPLFRITCGPEIHLSGYFDDISNH